MREAIARFLPFSFFTLWLTLTLGTLTLAQGLPRGRAAELGFSPQRLARIDAVMREHVDQKKIAGSVTLVARHGKIAQLGVYGMADREAGRPMQTDTIFRLASMTKPVTSVAIIMLYEEGRLMLTDPVSKYLPEFKEIKVLPPEDSDQTEPVKARGPITIHNLLTHTSGLSYHWNSRLGEMYNNAGINHGLMLDENTTGEDIRALAGIPLLFHPGERFEYGLSIDVLGRLVEVVSGMTLDEFLQSRLFGPLGMKDTHFFLPAEKLNRLAAVYRPGENGEIERIGDGMQKGPGALVFSVTTPYAGPQCNFAGGGGLVGTVSDYARFAQMMLNKGELDGVRILGSKTVEWMTQDHLVNLDGTPGFGLGFGVVRNAGDLKEIGSVGGYSWGGFFFTSFHIDPEEDMVIVYMSQLHPAEGLKLRQMIKGLAYQAIVD